MRGQVINCRLESYSFMLDIKKISRSFQNVSNPYNAIFTQISGDEYGGMVFDTASKGEVQGAPIIQYEETDWQLLKRLSARLNTIIHPFMEEDKPQIYIGIPEGDKYIEETPHFEFSKAAGEYMVSQSNYGGWDELGMISCEVESYLSYKLCDKIIHNDITFAVAEKRTEMRQGVIINRYKFKPEKSLKQNIIFNPKFTGLSIDAEVIAVEADKLKLHLSIDEQQSIADAYWYQFNTSYTAEGSIGLYSMPEIGTSVKLYCPKADETTAYIRTVNRTDGGTNPKTQDPDVKYYETAYGKELMLSPDSLNLTAKHGKTHIHMNEGAGIEIKSNHDISISGPDISLSGGKISMSAGDSVKFMTGGSSILVDSVVHFKGVEGVTI